MGENEMDTGGKNQACPKSERNQRVAHVMDRIRLRMNQVRKDLYCGPSGEDELAEKEISIGQSGELLLVHKRDEFEEDLDIELSKEEGEDPVHPACSKLASDDQILKGSRREPTEETWYQRNTPTPHPPWAIMAHAGISRNR